MIGFYKVAVERISVDVKNVVIPVAVNVIDFNATGAECGILGFVEISTCELSVAVVDKEVNRFICLTHQGKEIEISITVKVDDGSMDGPVSRVDFFGRKLERVRSDGVGWPLVGQHPDATRLDIAKFSHDKIQIAISVHVPRTDIGNASDVFQNWTNFELPTLSCTPHPVDTTSLVIFRIFTAHFCNDQVLYAIAIQIARVSPRGVFELANGLRRTVSVVFGVKPVNGAMPHIAKDGN